MKMQTPSLLNINYHCFPETQHFTEEDIQGLEVRKKILWRRACDYNVRDRRAAL